MGGGFVAYSANITPKVLRERREKKMIFWLISTVDFSKEFSFIDTN